MKTEQPDQAARSLRTRVRLTLMRRADALSGLACSHRRVQTARESLAESAPTTSRFATARQSNEVMSLDRRSETITENSDYRFATKYNESETTSTIRRQLRKQNSQYPLAHFG